MPSKSRATTKNDLDKDALAYPDIPLNLESNQGAYDDEHSDASTQEAIPSNHEGNIDQSPARLQENSYEDIEHLELFEADSAWEKVLQGARKARASRSKDSRPKSVPSLEAQMIRNILKATSKARSIFKKLSERHITEDIIKESEVQLEEALAQIDEQVIELDAADAEAQTSETLKDLNTDAIPKSVSMLQSALRYRTKDYSSPDDTEFLRSMISIQDNILILCRIAAPSKGRPTKQRVAPHLRKVRKVFQAELNKRERLTALKRTERILEESHERRREERRKEKEENAQRRMENALKIKEELDRNEELLLGPRRQMDGLRRRPRNQ